MGMMTSRMMNFGSSLDSGGANTARRPTEAVVQPKCAVQPDLPQQPAGQDVHQLFIVVGNEYALSLACPCGRISPGETPFWDARFWPQAGVDGGGISGGSARYGALLKRLA